MFAQLAETIHVSQTEDGDLMPNPAYGSSDKLQRYSRRAEAGAVGGARRWQPRDDAAAEQLFSAAEKAPPGAGKGDTPERRQSAAER